MTMESVILCFYLFSNKCCILVFDFNENWYPSTINGASI